MITSTECEHQNENTEQRTTKKVKLTKYYSQDMQIEIILKKLIFLSTKDL